MSPDNTPRYMIFGPKPEECAEHGHQWRTVYARSGPWGAQAYSRQRCDVCGAKRLQRDRPLDYAAFGYGYGSAEGDNGQVERLRCRIRVLEHRLRAHGLPTDTPNTGRPTEEGAWA